MDAAVGPKLLDHISDTLAPAGTRLAIAGADLQPGAAAGLKNANVVLEAQPEPAGGPFRVLLRVYAFPSVIISGRTAAENEAAVLELLGRASPGLAPKLLLKRASGAPGAGPEEEQDWNVIEYITNEGGLTPQEAFARGSQAMALLATVHGVDLAKNPNSFVLDVPAEELRLVPDSDAVGPGFLASCGDGEYGAKLAATWTKVQQVSDVHGDVFASLPREALIHGDSHAGNFLKTGDGLRLIDFEGARVGCELEDLGSFFVVVFPPLSGEQEAALLSDYRHHAGSRTCDMLDKLQGQDGDLQRALSLFKIRKLCRMISFFNDAVDKMGPEAASSPAANALAGGARFFLGLLDNILQSL
ncbi:kinase-like domain-containing protein [Hyaloraphidium curvatum]|nr:kinase-like domain-containing protein [Hyaloraphidium curvatum]